MNGNVTDALVDPAVLFFVLGLIAGLLRSNLEIPAPVAKFLSLYLLMALGFKGGRSLAETGFTSTTVKVLVLAALLALVIPLYLYPLLSRRIDRFDAAAIAATYGSVSAVTFITASQFLTSRGEDPGGYMTVALVVMESPAILMGVLLASWTRHRLHTGEPLVPSPVRTSADALGPGEVLVDQSSDPEEAAKPSRLGVRSVLHEAFTDGAHLLLIGSLVIGAVSGTKGAAAMTPFIDSMFKGLLAFFLLEMGLLVSRQLRTSRGLPPFLIGCALVVPLVNAALALTIGTIGGLAAADLTLLAVLAASGSYIVVPAVARFAIPEAAPSRYFTMALAITFPFNVLIGIPLYHEVATRLAG
jgi:hypothetical protein